MSFFKWLFPGMQVKRWVLIAILGLIFFTGGVTFFAISKTAPANNIFLPPSILVVILFIVIGPILILIGIRNWFHSIISALLPQEERLVDIIDRRRLNKKGMRIVAIGGGSGLSFLLRGLKEITSNIVAVVTVSDDGGSSGILRKELGVLPPGDIRNCLVALADTEPLLCDLFQYRFTEGEGLLGHSFGNLYLAAMTNVTGDFLQAVRESSKVLAIRGKVLPATLESVVLCGELSDGSIIEGESKVGKSCLPIKKVFLKPSSPNVLNEVINEIKEADVVILGPGSLFTSIIPNLLINGLLDSLKSSGTVKIYVCNIMTQPGETDDFTASRHVATLLQYLGDGIIDYAIVNEEVPEKSILERYLKDGAKIVEPDFEEIERMGVKSVVDKLLGAGELIRHDPKKLAKAVQELFAASREGLS